MMSTQLRITFYPFLVLILFFLNACSSSGGDGDSNNNINNSVSVSGVFFNMEGVEYRTSTGKAGITGAAGTFSVDKDTTIEFYLGGIVFGSTTARTTVTVIDLVPGAIDESNLTTINIMRFLLSLDSDDDLSNGIQINLTTRSSASTIEFTDFSLSETEFEVAALNAAGSIMAGGLVSPDVASAQLQTDLFRTLFGYYEGTFSGDDSGTWSMTVDAIGNITGDGISVSGDAFTLAGSVSSSGDANADAAVGGTSTGAKYSGTLTRDGSFSGTWLNTTFAEAGSFSGNKTTPPATTGGDGGVSGGGTGTTIADLSEGVGIFNTVAANFASFESTDILISAPDIAENGAVVPVTITFPSTTGQVWLFVDSNDEKIAGMADLLIAGKSGLLSTRVKMKQSGNIITVLDDGTGTLRSAKKLVMVTIGAVPVVPDCAVVECFPAFTATSIKIRATGGIVKLLASNSMSTVDYITNILLQVDGVSVARAYFTPFISKNPYLSLSYPSSLTLSNNVVTTMNVTGDRSASIEVLAAP